MSTAASPPPASGSPSGTRAAWGIAILVVATVLIGALAPARHAEPVRPVGTGTGAGDAASACQEWTDGCVVCRRLPEGPACSLPGIACQPGERRCLRPGG